MGEIDTEALKERAQMQMRIKFLEQEVDEMKNRNEEMIAMLHSMNETIIRLDHTIQSVATPLNNDIKELQGFAKDYQNMKNKALGGISVIFLVFGAIWEGFKLAFEKIQG